jgi:hypothetical protein
VGFRKLTWDAPTNSYAGAPVAWDMQAFSFLEAASQRFAKESVFLQQKATGDCSCE